MQPINNINNPDGLDEMLKQAFLDLDMSNTEDSKLMDEVANNVLSKDWPLETKQSTKNKVKSSLGSAKQWIWILSSLVAISVLSVAAYYLFSDPVPVNNRSAESVLPVITTVTKNNDEVKTENNNVITTNETNPEPLVYKTTDIALPIADKDNYVTHSGTKGKTPVREQNTNIVEVKDQKGIVKNQEPPADQHPKELIKNKNLPEAESNVSETNTPKNKEHILSAEEIAKHKKDIQKMEDEFAGLKFQDYSIIKAKKTDAAIEKNFYMKRTEVTIYEYKVFLTDLLLKGKTKEYDIAKPKLENIWKDPKDKNNRNFLDQYFKKQKYENHPVICISPEGMELYCLWVKEEIESYYKRNNKTLKVTIRLPNVNEWKYVASEGNKSHKYGTSNGKLKDASWSHLIFVSRDWTANFIETQGKFVAGDDTVVVEEKKKRIKERQGILHKVRKETFTTHAYRYPTVDFQVFNLSGNVSEIVTYTDEKGNRKYRTIGGNWNSTKDFLKIEAPDEFNGNTQPSPYIGFRPVLVLEN